VRLSLPQCEIPVSFFLLNVGSDGPRFDLGSIFVFTLGFSCVPRHTSTHKPSNSVSQVPSSNFPLVMNEAEPGLLPKKPVSDAKKSTGEQGYCLFEHAQTLCMSTWRLAPPWPRFANKVCALRCNTSSLQVWQVFASFPGAHVQCILAQGAFHKLTRLPAQHWPVGVQVVSTLQF
jgi:hypothetical protein